MNFTTEKVPIKPEDERIEILAKGVVIGYATLQARHNGEKAFHVVLEIPDYELTTSCGRLVQGHGETIEEGVFNAITESKAGAKKYIAGIEELQKQLFD